MRHSDEVGIVGIVGRCDYDDSNKATTKDLRSLPKVSLVSGEDGNNLMEGTADKGPADKDDVEPHQRVWSDGG